MFWHAIRVGVCIFLSTHSSGMNFKFLISVGMFRLAVKVEVCILSATPSSGMNKPFSPILCMDLNQHYKVKQSHFLSQRKIRDHINKRKTTFNQKQHCKGILCVYNSYTNT